VRVRRPGYEAGRAGAVRPARGAAGTDLARTEPRPGRADRGTPDRGRGAEGEPAGPDPDEQGRARRRGAPPWFVRGRGADRGPSAPPLRQVRVTGGLRGRGGAGPRRGLPVR